MILRLDNINIKDSNALSDLLKKDEVRSYKKFIECIKLLQEFSNNNLTCNYEIAPYLRKGIRKILTSNFESNGTFLIFGYFIVRKEKINYFDKTKIINFSLKWDATNNKTTLEILNIIGHEDSLNKIKVVKIITNIDLLITYFYFNEYEFISENN